MVKTMRKKISALLVGMVLFASITVKIEESHAHSSIASDSIDAPTNILVDFEPSDPIAQSRREIERKIRKKLKGKKVNRKIIRKIKRRVREHRRRKLRRRIIRAIENDRKRRERIERKLRRRIMQGIFERRECEDRGGIFDDSACYYDD